MGASASCPKLNLVAQQSSMAGFKAYGHFVAPGRLVQTLHSHPDALQVPKSGTDAIQSVPFKVQSLVPIPTDKYYKTINCVHQYGAV